MDIQPEFPIAEVTVPGPILVHTRFWRSEEHQEFGGDCFLLLKEWLSRRCLVGGCSRCASVSGAGRKKRSEVLAEEDNANADSANDGGGDKEDNDGGQFLSCLEFQATA